MTLKVEHSTIHISALAQQMSSPAGQVVATDLLRNLTAGCSVGTPHALLTPEVRRIVPRIWMHLETQDTLAEHFWHASLVHFLGENPDTVMRAYGRERLDAPLTLANATRDHGVDARTTPLDEIVWEFLLPAATPRFPDHSQRWLAGHLRLFQNLLGRGHFLMEDAWKWHEQLALRIPSIGVFATMAKARYGKHFLRPTYTWGRLAPHMYPTMVSQGQWPISFFHQTIVVHDIPQEIPINLTLHDVVHWLTVMSRARPVRDACYLLLSLFNDATIDGHSDYFQDFIEMLAIDDMRSFIRAFRVFLDHATGVAFGGSGTPRIIEEYRARYGALPGNLRVGIEDLFQERENES